MHKKRNISESRVLYTLIAVMAGFAVGALMLTVAGINPATVYAKLFQSVFGKPQYMIWSLIYATPLIFTGLSVAFCFRMGMFNIGAEGQYVVGSLAACAMGVLVDLPAAVHIPLCILTAAVAGAIWGFLVGLLKVGRGINEVLSFIMFNWIAFYLSNFVVNLAAIHKEGGGEATKDILDSASIRMPAGIGRLLDCPDINFGFILAILAAFIIWFILKKTTLGYRISAVGRNANAAKYSGINAGKTMLALTCIAGAMAGIGGATQVLGMSGRVSQFAGQEGYGFQGITVALIGSSSPIGCIFSGLFYGAMKYGGSKLSLIDTPSEVVDIIMGTVILLIAVSHVFRTIARKKTMKKEVE
jgi:ABC-type uncharacterized transport system permease subunit